MNQFTEEFLKSYEEQIRKLPLDELYEVMDIIKKDSSPERINIVKIRIRELEATEGYAQNNSFHFKKNYTLHTKQTWSEYFKDFLHDLRYGDSYVDEPQILPDTDGFCHFIFVQGFGLGIVLAVLFFGAGMGNGGRWTNNEFHDLTFGNVLTIIQFVPIASTVFWYCMSSKADLICNYWLAHHKTALTIASVLSLHSIATLITGKYDGIFYSGTDPVIYVIAGATLIYAVLFIINAFFPLSKKFRPKNGLSLLAFAAALELTAHSFFG